MDSTINIKLQSAIQLIKGKAKMIKRNQSLKIYLTSKKT